MYQGGYPPCIHPGYTTLYIRLRVLPGLIPGLIPGLFRVENVRVLHF